jgi:hypothetical protein
MQGADAETPRLGDGEVEQGPAATGAACVRDEVEIVDEAVAAAMLDAEADR